MAELERHALNGASVVLFSPRRYGKTSLVRRMQHALEDRAYTFAADFFQLASLDDLAARLARGVYLGLHRHEPLLDRGLKAIPKIFRSFRPTIKLGDPDGMEFSVAVERGKHGFDLLAAALEDLGRFVSKADWPVHLALDEFQDIVDLGEPRIEAAFRSFVQDHRVSVFFVGSRRRVLLSIFNDRSRPFWQSSIMYPLPALPRADLMAYLTNLFARGGKKCSGDLAGALADRVRQHPYYAQALGYWAFEACEAELCAGELDAAFHSLLEGERYAFEAQLAGLSRGQQVMLTALAVEETATPTAGDYMARHGLTVGGVQSALKKLFELDLVERSEDGGPEGHGDLHVVDPVFRVWLARRVST
jgi:DNA-binding transcriptional ArsR family regulator